MTPDTIRRWKEFSPDMAYELIADIARYHALIWQAAGGTIVIVHPEVQKEEGIYEQIQETHMKEVQS